MSISQVCLTFPFYPPLPGPFHPCSLLHFTPLRSFSDTFLSPPLAFVTYSIHQFIIPPLPPLPSPAITCKGLAQALPFFTAFFPILHRFEEGPDLKHFLPTPSTDPAWPADLLQQFILLKIKVSAAACVIISPAPPPHPTPLLEAKLL